MKPLISVDVASKGDPQTFEDETVTEVYDTIAQSFSETRNKPWPGVSTFIATIPKDCKVVEVGCGNGRNLLAFPSDNEVSGCDLSPEMVKLCQSCGLNNVVVANNLNLPYKSNSFDYTLSVAVIHHLSTSERRKQAFEELVRITKPGGKLYLQVWSTKQPEKSKINQELKKLTTDEYASLDCLVPWSNRRTGKTMKYRYYHFLELEEFKSLVTSPHTTIHKIYWEEGNWTAIIRKHVK